MRQQCKGVVTMDNNGALAGATHILPLTNAVADELRDVALVVTNRAMMVLTTNVTVQSLTVAQSTDRLLDLGAAGTVLTVESLTVSGMPYTRNGLYTTNDWNGYVPVPSNVTGAGAIYRFVPPKGTTIMIR